MGMAMLDVFGVGVGGSSRVERWVVNGKRVDRGAKKLEGVGIPGE
jgi:hypothetical protein